MSINIIVGSDPDDYTKIRQTIDLLQFVYKTDNLDDFNIDHDSVQDLIDWYNSMYAILTDPDFASEPV